MKQIKLFFELTVFSILFVLLMFSPSWAATYYVDATNGNDSNPGNSESAPWKTISMVNSFSFYAGDNIYFKKDEVWREQLTIPSSGAAGYPITFGAYGSGAKPQILGSTQLSTWNQSNIPANSWKATLAAAPTAVWFVNKDGKIKWGKKNTVLTDVNADFDWHWDSNGYLIVYAETNPATRYTSVEANVLARPDCITTNGHDYITIQDLELAYSYYSGIKIPIESNNITIQRNTTHHNGSLYIPQDSEGGSKRAGVHSAGQNIMIQNNTLHDGGMHGIFFYQGTDTVIAQYNKIYDCYHIALEAKQDVGPETLDEVVQNIIFRYNEVYTTSDYADTSVSMDHIMTYAQQADKYVDNVEIYYNVVYKLMGKGITINQRTRNSQVYNNTVYGTNPNVGEINTMGILVQGSSKGVSNVIIKNNIAVDAGTGGCFVLVDPSILAACDYNLWYQSAGGTATFTAIPLHYHYDYFAAYKTAMGGVMEQHTLWEDPHFVSTSNLRLQSSSPAINAGTNVNLIQDYNGTTVPQGNGVDIGASEFIQATQLSPPRNLRIH